MLQGYKDHEVLKFLKYGFPLECDQSKSRMNVPDNHSGATQFPDEIDAYLAKQINNKTLIGPFDNNPFGERARFSPVNTRPKKDSAERRVILDLSHPDECSVNAGIDKDWYRQQQVELLLPTVFSMVKIINELKSKEQVVLLFKRDLSGAYKQVGVCVGDIHILGFTHRGRFYFDVTLPMGLTNSAMIMQRVSDMLLFLYNQGTGEGLNYLDDMGDAKGQKQAIAAFNRLGEVVASGWGPRSSDKSMGTHNQDALFGNRPGYTQHVCCKCHRAS